MRIYADIILQGAKNKIKTRALIDTGAKISLMPFSIATKIGAWRTNQQVNVVGIHGETKTLPIIVAYLYFPLLNNIGGQFAFAMSNIEQEVIVGMDILKPLGITIDTKTHQLSVKNEIWEAFKTLSAIGVLVIGGVKLLEALFEKKD
jgi:predicted aspartyl protease